MDWPPALWPVSPREVRWGFAGPSRVRGRALDIGGLQLLDRLTGQPALSPLSAHPSPLVRFTSHLSPLTPHLSFVSPLTPHLLPFTLSPSFAARPSHLTSRPLWPLASQVCPLAVRRPAVLRPTIAAPPRLPPRNATRRAAPLFDSCATDRQGAGVWANEINSQYIGGNITLVSAQHRA